MGNSSSWRTFLTHVGIATAVFAAANVATYWTSGYFEHEREYYAKVSGLFAMVKGSQSGVVIGL